MFILSLTDCNTCVVVHHYSYVGTTYYTDILNKALTVLLMSHRSFIDALKINNKPFIQRASG